MYLPAWEISHSAAALCTCLSQLLSLHISLSASLNTPTTYRLMQLQFTDLVHNSLLCSASSPERRLDFSFYKRSHLLCVCRTVAAINPPRLSASSVYYVCYYLFLCLFYTHTSKDSCWNSVLCSYQWINIYHTNILIINECNTSYDVAWSIIAVKHTDLQSCSKAFWWCKLCNTTAAGTPCNKAALLAGLLPQEEELGYLLHPRQMNDLSASSSSM